MFRRVHQKLGTAGFIISIIALVAAMAGGAIAAQQGLNGKQKKQVQNIAKSEAKKFAKKGPRGETGATGATGPQGPKGDPGSNGINGASPVGSNFTGTKGSCTEGGIEYKVGAASNLVCNGQKGAQGAQGVPGTTGFTKTLPGEETETGAWAVGITPPGTSLPVRNAISFPIPLADPLPAANVHYVKQGETAPTECAGGTAAEPKAEPGHLCIYVTLEQFLTFQAILDPTSNAEAPGAGATGAIIRYAGEEEAQAWGTWAVTAEVE